MGRKTPLPPVLATVVCATLPFRFRQVKPSGILPRRTTGNTASFVAQLHWQSAARVHVIDTLTRLYHPGRIYGEQSNVRALHDLRRMADELAALGLIENATPITNPTEDEIATALAALPKQMVRMEL